MNRRLAKWRCLGFGVVWDAGAAPGPVRAEIVAPPPQVNFTVVHVEAGALVSFGGIDPRYLAASQQRAAITATTITEGETQ